MFEEFINQYGMELLYTAITAIVGYIGIVAKNVYVKYINDKTKQAVAKTVVQYVEQVYKDMHGDEKLAQALSAASEMLLEKGISISRLELRALIEAAVAEFNEVFSKTVVEAEEK